MKLDNIINNFNYSFHNDYNNFKLGGKRIINSPNENLKNYQYLIKNYLEKKYNFPFFITGYRKGLSIKDNASIHIGKKYILNLDIKNFFGSINKEMLRKEFKNINNNTELFLDYITYKGVLPQGPPCSPIISNIVFNKIDNILKKGLFDIEKNITYSRYVDDISIGFDNYQNRYSIFELIKKNLIENGFTLNKEKIKLFEHNKKLYVTGMIIHKNEVGIGYKKYKRAKKIIYLYLKYENGYFPSIKGMLLYIKGVDYKRYEQLKNNYYNDYFLDYRYTELFGIIDNGKKNIKVKLNKDLSNNNRFKKGKFLLEYNYNIGNKKNSYKNSYY